MGCTDLVLTIHAIQGWSDIEPTALWRFLGRLHPLIVHFPIALLIMAFLAEAAGTIGAPLKRSRVAVFCLYVGTIGAVVAAWFGWVNADHEPYGRAVTPMIEMHRILGIGTAIFAGMAATCVMMDRRRTKVWTMYGYRLGLFLSVVLVGFSGHIGGQLVYGEEYLVEVFRKPTTPAPERLVTSEQPPVELTATANDPTFADVRPIFEARCFECHGEAKQKAGLRLDSTDAIFAGFPDSWVITPGASSRSVLVERISLPADDLDLMPPNGNRLPDEYIARIRAWIDAGAPDPTRNDAAPSDPETIASSEPVEPDTPFGLAPLTDDERADQAAAIDRIRAQGGAASLIAQESPGVDVNLAVMSGDLDRDTLALLNGLEGTLLWLNLSGATLTNDDLARLGDFPNLRRLHLDRSTITDDGLSHLTSLDKLEYLNLYGTKVTDEGIAQLDSMTNLRRLYVWDTAVTPDGIESLRASLPDLEIVGAVTLDVVAETDAEATEESEEESKGG